MDKPKVLPFHSTTDLEPLKAMIMALPFSDLVLLIEWMKKQNIVTANHELRVDSSQVQ